MKKKKETVEEIVNEVVEEVVEETVTDELLDAIVEETIKEVIEEETVEAEVEAVEEENTGAVAVAVVTDCAQLNVRQEPNKTAKVVCVIAKGTEVQVDVDKSTEDFYKVSVSGKEGYCVKQFISIK